MAKRDNPRLRQSVSRRGKNKRSNHEIGPDGRLQKEAPSKSFASKGAGRGKTEAIKSGRAKPVAATAKRQGFSDKKSAPTSRGRRSAAKPAPARSEGAPASRSARREAELDPNLIIGRNPVMEAIKSGRSIDKLLIQIDAVGSAKKIASMAAEAKINVHYVEKIVLDKLCPGRPHQGVAAYAAAKNYAQLDDIFAAAQERREDPLIVILDGLEDPHNLGAVLRSADGAGAHGVIIPSRRAVGLTEVVAKASAGAIEYVPVVKVTNINRCIEELQERGLWVAALDMDGENYSDAELSGPMAIVIGGEGRGVSRLAKEKVDKVLSIPMRGKIDSLNASNAAAVLLYEIDRQRRNERMSQL